MLLSRENLLRQHHTRRIRRNDPRTVPHGQGRERMLSSEWFLVCDGLSTLSLDGSKTRSFQGTLLAWTFCSRLSVANADDLAAAASSFRDLMTAFAPAYHSVDHIAGLNWNHRKCCWVQYGSERRESLLNWLSDNCEDFREMQVVSYAKTWAP